MTQDQRLLKPNPAAGGGGGGGTPMLTIQIPTAQNLQTAVPYVLRWDEAGASYVRRVSFSDHLPFHAAQVISSTIRAETGTSSMPTTVGSIPALRVPDTPDPITNPEVEIYQTVDLEIPAEGIFPGELYEATVTIGGVAHTVTDIPAMSGLSSLKTALASELNQIAGLPDRAFERHVTENKLWHNPDLTVQSPITISRSGAHAHQWFLATGGEDGPVEDLVGNWPIKMGGAPPSSFSIEQGAGPFGDTSIKIGSGVLYTDPGREDLAANGFSINVFVKIEAAPFNSDNVIYSHDNELTQHRFWRLDGSEGNVAFHIHRAGSPNYRTVAAPSRVAPGWHLITVSVPTAGEMVLYIDGSEVARGAAGTWAGAVSTDTASVRIGAMTGQAADKATDASFFYADYWLKPLDAAEVFSIWQSLKQPFLFQLVTLEAGLTFDPTARYLAETLDANGNPIFVPIAPTSATDLARASAEALNAALGVTTLEANGTKMILAPQQSITGPVLVRLSSARPLGGF